MPLLAHIRPQDRFTVLTPHGQRRTGRAMIVTPTHAVLDLGGAHGIAGIAVEHNILRITRDGVLIAARG